VTAGAAPPGAASAELDPSHFFWLDTSIVQPRYEKAGAALVAVRDTLQREPSLCAGVDEFLDHYRVLAELDPADFDAVWRDPYAYFWTRLAFELTRAARRGAPVPALARAYATAQGCGDAKAALAMHLRELQRLVLGACLRAGRDIAFRTPLEVRLPLALPGTRSSLVGNRRVAILGCTAGRLHVRGEQSPAPLLACPAIEVQGLELLLQPHVHNLPGLGFYREESDEGFEVQTKHAHVLEAALRILARHVPESFAQLGRFVRMISLQTRDPETYTNVTHSDLPGTVLVTVVQHPCYVADALIHELHHHRLFCLEEVGPFLAGPRDDLEAEARYLSPWRADLRPLHGILHGAYVFIATTRFWLQLLAASEEIDEPTHLLARSRVVGGVLQLGIALHQLARHARLTSFGAALVRQLESDLANLRARVAAEGLSPETPFVRCHLDGTIEIAESPDARGPWQIREQLRTHVRRFAPPEQAEDILRNALQP
jgi:HEXXH motif-containing protein